MDKNKKIIVIVGPTASGKSDIANELGSIINGEVISADSMQVYKGMDIGTGKIKKEEQKVTHWGLDIISPDKPYSVALFQEYARSCIKDIRARGKRPILCGGTGFYIRSVVDDYDFPKGEQIDNPIREKYLKLLKDNGAQFLWNELNEKDPKSAKIIHVNNSVRVIRALEIFEEGKSYADQVNKLSSIPQKYEALFFGLKVDSEILKTRIDKRVEQMFEIGLIDEVKNLLDCGYKHAITSASAIGYKEVVNYLDGALSKDEAMQQIKVATRQYAKRQRTWFNADKRINWINYNEIDVNKAVSEIILCCDKDQ